VGTMGEGGDTVAALTDLVVCVWQFCKIVARTDIQSKVSIANFNILVPGTN